MVFTWSQDDFWIALSLPLGKNAGSYRPMVFASCKWIEWNQNRKITPKKCAMQRRVMINDYRSLSNNVLCSLRVCFCFCFTFFLVSAWIYIPVPFVHSTSSAAVAAAAITTSFRSMNINERREERNQPKSFLSQKKVYFNRRSVGKFLFYSVSLCLPFHRWYVLFTISELAHRGMVCMWTERARASRNSSSSNIKETSRR